MTRFEVRIFVDGLNQVSGKEAAMTAELEKLLDAAKGTRLSGEESEKQRRSFAFGNTNIENPRITRETIDKEAEKLKQK